MYNFEKSDAGVFMPLLMGLTTPTDKKNEIDDTKYV